MPFQPNENLLSGLGFGVGAQGSGNVDGVALPAYKTVGQNTFFNFASGVISGGYRTTGRAPGLLLRWSVRPSRRGHSDGRRIPEEHGAQRRGISLLAGSGVLCPDGRKRKAAGVRIRSIRLIVPTTAGGAFEIAARTGDFRVDEGLFAAGFASLTTSPKFAREWVVVGGNWHSNRIFQDFGGLRAYELPWRRRRCESCLGTGDP